MLTATILREKRTRRLEEEDMNEMGKEGERHAQKERERCTRAEKETGSRRVPARVAGRMGNLKGRPSTVTSALRHLDVATSCL